MNNASPPLPAPPSGFDELFADFLAELLGARSRATLPACLPLEAWQSETERLVASAGHEFHRRRQDREARLATHIAATAPTVTGESIDAFAAERIAITPAADFGQATATDLCYVKINHGFWEQLYALFGVADPTRMRVTGTGKFHGQYVASGFLDALARMFETGSQPDGDWLRFPCVHLGVSLASGTHDHPDVLAGFAARSAAEKRIVIGAAIGLVSWWETLAPGRRPAFCDGSFPKRALAMGSLRATLARAATCAERIVFVVPGHLAGIRLVDATVPQETLLVPATTVHESWAAGLYATARHLLGRIAADGRVLVITQSAVFSALLGFFLTEAKRRLLPAANRLAYFDLGQVLDVATPDVGGHWARTHAVGDTALFRTESA